MRWIFRLVNASCRWSYILSVEFNVDLTYLALNLALTLQKMKASTPAINLQVRMGPELLTSCLLVASSTIVPQYLGFLKSRNSYKA